MDFGKAICGFVPHGEAAKPGTIQCGRGTADELKEKGSLRAPGSARFDSWRFRKHGRTLQKPWRRHRVYLFRFMAGGMIFSNQPKRVKNGTKLSRNGRIR